MTLSTDLPTGLYLISSFTDKHFHAGRIPVSAPSHYVWTYPYRDSRTVRLPGSASQEETFYYSSDSTADFAFLEDIDGDSPWALAARAREDAKKNGTLSAPSSPGSDRGDSGASTLFDINEDSAPSTPPSPLSDLCMTPPLTDVKSTTDLYGLETRLEKAVSQAQKQATDGVFSTFVGAGEEAPEVRIQPPSLATIADKFGNSGFWRSYQTVATRSQRSVRRLRCRKGFCRPAPIR